jgi:hypothetical protein
MRAAIHIEISPSLPGEAAVQRWIPQHTGPIVIIV